MSDRAKKVLTAAEILVLGPVAAIVVLGVVPAAFGIEWFCLGSAPKAAAFYWDTFAMVTFVTWLALIVGATSAHARGSQNFATALPAVWFLVLVASSFVAAAGVGSQPCSDGGGFIL